MDRKRIGSKFGKYKMLFTRLMGYVGIVSFLMLLKVFAEDEPLGFSWVVWLGLAILLCVGISVFDSLFVLEGDSNYSFSKTPRMVAMDVKIDRILSMLEEK